MELTVERRTTEWQKVGDAPRLFLAEEMDAPQLFELAGCRIALFSTRCPTAARPNEDAAALIPVAEDSAVLAVADGMGGGRGGATAARLAVEALAEAIAGAVGEGRDLRAGVLNGIEIANARVAGLGTGGATTLLAAEIGSGRVRTYHVGDSEAAVVGQRGKVKLQTVSHTPSGYGREAGLLSEKEAMFHEERHLLLNLIGSTEMRIDLGPRLRLASRDTLVIGSDGLFDNWHLEQILDRIRQRPLDSVAGGLARATLDRMTDPAGREPAKPDDLTFLLVRRAR